MSPLAAAEPQTLTNTDGVGRSVGRTDGLGKQASKEGKQGVNVNRENTDHAKREADPDKPRGPEVKGATSEAVARPPL